MYYEVSPLTVLEVAASFALVALMVFFIIRADRQSRKTSKA